MTELTTAPLHRLERFGTLIASGPEAKGYLQGQLSFDLDRLTPARMELATCNSAQGRVQALLWLVERSDEIALVLPASMIDATLSRLKKYVLRSKVKIEDGRSRLAVFGTSGPNSTAPRTHQQINGRSFVQWPGEQARTLVIAASDTQCTVDESFERDWHRADITAGLPQVYPSTHETFVAQMLNADLLGAIGFEKGCYTGQEIIARTHFRGAIKRRMFRYRTDHAFAQPGMRIVSGEQHAGDVVDAASTPNGSELLAVVSLSSADSQLEVDGPVRSTLQRLPLPYAV